jgi:protein-tyrosine phosphatase
MEPSLLSLRGLQDTLVALRSLGPRERRRYLRLQMWNRLFWRRQINPPLPRTVRSFLFVCHGNIIRSPFAAAAFLAVLSTPLKDRISTLSAGLDTTPGKPADPRAIELAREFGVSLEAHRTQRLSPAVVERTDLILAMDTLNVAKFLVRYPAAQSKLLMLGSFCGPTQVSRLDIPDPYNGTRDDIRHCYHTISRRLSSLAQALAHSVGDGRPSTPAGGEAVSLGRD